MVLKRHNKSTSQFASLILFLMLLSCTACQKSSSESPVTTIYLVRHAEKIKGVKDPDLSPSGFQRAKKLADTLRSLPIEQTYATQYKRTQQTVAEVAKSIEKKTIIYKAHAIKKLGQTLTQTYPGKHVLVAGHSNTIPKIIKELGVKEEITIDYKTGYDDLYVVFWRKGKPAKWMHLHYGKRLYKKGKQAKTPKGSSTQPVNR